MRFQTPLVPGRLVRRYKRFLADVELDEDGRTVVAHCPNPGSMLGLAEEGMRVWLEPNDDSRKKLKFGWRLVELPGGHLAGIDTSVPNRIVAEALAAGHVQGLSGYRSVRREVPYGTNSRVDFLLRESGLPDAYVEVKNVHLNRTGDLAEFPDCVTERGARHLAELSAVVAEGFRAVMLYVVQRTDCAGLALARDLDPGYGSAFDRACAAGVEAICHGTRITLGGVEIASELPVLERVPDSG
ncbi:MAG: DNA/RNA nuclease SfsA [Boseongicola sp. SB0664_bin_43]|uniref:Sugar fermentation stimulation protein homolog n=1 Tax=Boseongicola sp. SB0664_bin_43 TaxID=2604844 RepID=A0A6B0Y281_9RHOB|nr:DNA/RNA nuclease SfsA [Boseongicola sp. SB0664_bin_43]MYK32492.1 DNA/RNA nuclease SfsA [Boseongicola sp. SB0670_bin_30]